MSTNIGRPHLGCQNLAIHSDWAARRRERSTIRTAYMLRHPENLKCVMFKQLWPGEDIGTPDIGGFQNTEPMSCRLGTKMLSQQRLDLVTMRKPCLRICIRE